MSLPFHPLINSWFTGTYGKPTPVQEEAWPLIAKGEHVLAIAPTGSGKTLTAFLAAISRFAEGGYQAESLSVLYVSPLKALNEDIRRNLIQPLEGIRAAFEKAGEPFPAVRVETRSGDTPQSERRRFLSLPPSILALTPESLGIILLNPRGRQVLSTVRYVIMDEIHAALGSKRGCYLSCQIDRLALTAGEFQRVALSATVKPPEAAADFSGGLKKSSGGISGGYEKRKVHIVMPADAKEISFRVIYPGAGGTVAGEADAGIEHYGKRYVELIRFIIERIKAGQGKGTILVFTDSRRRAERITFLLNKAAEKEPGLAGGAGPASVFSPASQSGFESQAGLASKAGLAGKTLAYCHHGSLSKEVRREVEKALAAGEVSCVVATGSLELGIDIGGVDEVILAGSPGAAAAALQRVGRSGHGVGMTSRGWLVPFHGLDLLQAAAIAGAMEERELETTGCIENPLDILAQIILALIAEKDRNEDELYETIRGFYVYRNLSRAGYDGVVRMLAGAYEGTRLRELRRQLFRDNETKTLSAAPGTLLLLYTSGGVIASRGYYSLRLAPDGRPQGGSSHDGKAGAKIGELDEEFVWERRLGDCFDFGSRSWKITHIGDEAVEVVPVPGGADYAPFWTGETMYRSSVLSRRILEVLDGYYPKAWTSLNAEKMLGCFSGEAKKALEDFLYSQWSFQQGMPLPGPSFIPVEIIDDPAGRGDSYSIIFYSFRGGAVNFPLSLALARDLEAAYGLRVEGAADDNAVFIRLPRSIGEDPAGVIRESLRGLCEGGRGEERFRERLESSGVFGAAFREAAERSLILPRSPYGKRMPLWITRQKSKRLFDAVSSYRDFPAAAEAWRTCMKETFDMEGFGSLLEEIGAGALVLDFFKTRQPSPFSKGLAWAETNVLMYEYDERPDLLGPPSKGGAGPSLSDQVIAEALGNAGARPPLKAELVRDFCSRLRRELPGWAPEDSLALCEWVKERVAIPSNGKDEEWERLLENIPPELRNELEADPSLGGRLRLVGNTGAAHGTVVHRDWAGIYEHRGDDFSGKALSQWLRYEGPVSPNRICDVFFLSTGEAEDAVRALAGQEELVRDVVVDNESGLVCDRENLELLLRLGRRKRRPEVRERPARVLVPFLARRQGLLRDSGGDAAGGMADNTPWKTLAGIGAPAKLWETEIFPCRCPSYSGEMLDREIREGRLLWYGTGREKAAFCRPEDLDLVLPVSPAPRFSGASSGLPPEFFDTPRSFWEIRDALVRRGETPGAGLAGNSAGCAAGLAANSASGSGIDSAARGRTDSAARGGIDSAAGGGIDSVALALWEEVWRGSLSSDSWAPVRKALESGFASLAAGSETRDYGSGGRRGALRLPRAVRERWKAGPPVRGNWFSIAGDPLSPESPDILEEEELNRDRVRLLLVRWGILARPLLEREAPALSWSRLLPAMRRMELAGELVAGRFFGGINSLQFASPRIAEELEEAEAGRDIYWMNAADPASPAGLAIGDILKPACEAAAGNPRPGNPQPRRVPSSRLCFRGAELLAVSNRGGRELEIFIPADDPDIAGVLAFIKLPRERKVQPENKIVIEKINGKAAAGSAYCSALTALGFVKDRGKMVLW